MPFFLPQGQGDVSRWRLDAEAGKGLLEDESLGEDGHYLRVWGFKCGLPLPEGSSTPCLLVPNPSSSPWVCISNSTTPS